MGDLGSRVSAYRGRSLMLSLKRDRIHWHIDSAVLPAFLVQESVLSLSRLSLELFLNAGRARLFTNRAIFLDAHRARVLNLHRARFLDADYGVAGPHSGVLDRSPCSRDQNVGGLPGW